MKRNNHILKVPVLLGAAFLFLITAEAQSSFDTLKIKLPKHYFQTVILLDGYRKPTQAINDTVHVISNKLKSYGVRQFVFSLNTPIATIDRPSSDSGVYKNTHILFTANYMRLQPQFEGISTHDLVKAGFGVRMIFNSGKKGVWFVDASPFVTKDASYPSKEYRRWASTILYSHNVSDKFNWRLGITKSFLWGNRLYLPFLGLRFGKLDKMNLSIQFPRSIHLIMPVSSKFHLTLYTKPQGGMFNFSNHDSLYSEGSDDTFHFTRYEINTGFRADVNVSPWFNLYFSTGFSTKNNITFYTDKTAGTTTKSLLPYDRFFYNKNLSPTLFINLGLSFRFGKTRSYYNNRNLYDVIDLNNTIDGGDNNLSNGNPQIPVTPKKKLSDMNLQAVQDLIDYNDF